MRRMVMTSLVASLFAMAALGAAQTQNERFFAGVVRHIDPANRVLTVEEASLEGPRMEFTIPQNLEILKAEESIGFNELQVGDPVAIEYTLTNGRPTVSSVKVITLPRE